MKPYTYFIKHKSTGLFYYGVKLGKNANPDTFWINYFTSSKAVKMLIERDGKDSFEIQVRKIFDTKEAAYNWEQKVIKRIIKCEKCLNAALGFSFDSNKNRNIKDKDGLTNYQKCARKAKNTMLNDIDENGLNTYQRNAYKIYSERDEQYRLDKSAISAKTMKENGTYEKNAMKHSEYQNEIMESGLTRAQETGLKVSETRKRMFEEGTLKKQTGSKNPASKKIHIYNENDELMFECHGTFQQICKEHKLPVSFFKKSYQNDGIRFPFEYKIGMSKKFYDDNKQFIGWYALKIN